jgi:hypothetical protein
MNPVRAIRLWPPSRRALLTAVACLAGSMSFGADEGNVQTSSEAMARFEAAEDSAERAVGAVRDAMRQATLRALAEAVRLDESLAASAVRLAVRVEDDPERVSHLERLLEGLDRRGTIASAGPSAAVETSRFLGLLRRGDRREARRALDRPGVKTSIDSATAIDRVLGGALPDFENMLSGSGVAGLDEAEQRATLELEAALLDPAEAGLGLGRWLDGGLPLPEVDARGLAEWFEAGAARR